MPDIPAREHEELLPGLQYGGRGPGGEYYIKDMGRGVSDSIWIRESTNGRLLWTPEDFEAIAEDIRVRGRGRG